MQPLVGTGRALLSRPAAAGKPAYNPVSALGVDALAYLDADSRYWGSNGSITQSAGLVSSWRDAITGLNYTQGTGSAQPVFDAASFNGAPSVAFDGIDDFLGTASHPFPTGAVNFEIWSVIAQDAPTSNAADRAIFTIGPNGTQNQISQRRFGSTGTNRARAAVGNGSTSLTLTDTTGVDFSTRHLLRTRHTPTTTYMSVDGGAEIALPAIPAVGAGMSRIGALDNTVASNFHWGRIACVAVTTAIFGSAKEAAFQTFMLSRRNL